jgi:phage pi2 protein 07
MNIFILDTDHTKNAAYHNDKHCSKMILEHTQMLMSSYHLTNSSALQDPIMYKLTHKNHPCTRWTNKSLDNWIFLYELTEALNSEFKSRYSGKSHTSFDKITYILETYGFPHLISKGLTDFAQAMPEEYKNKDAVTAYRTYYTNEKQHLAKWKNGKPSWYQIKG